MIHTLKALGGMQVAPHHLAAQAGRDVLRDGGNAVEAMVAAAAAAAIAVVYRPQTQSAVFTRYARFGQDLQAAVTAPRWLLGRTWGSESTSLKLESRFDPALVQALKAAGHAVEVLDEAFSDTMGHAGALVRHPNGLIDGAVDPRSDGVVAGV